MSRTDGLNAAPPQVVLEQDLIEFVEVVAPSGNYYEFAEERLEEMRAKLNLPRSVLEHAPSNFRGFQR
jgi:hypothetical protein